jgi:hypothetical protein
MKFLQLRSALEKVLATKTAASPPPEPVEPKIAAYLIKPSVKQVILKDGIARDPVDLNARRVIGKAPWWAFLQDYGKQKSNQREPGNNSTGQEVNQRRAQVRRHNANGAKKAGNKKAGGKPTLATRPPVVSRHHRKIEAQALSEAKARAVSDLLCGRISASEARNRLEGQDSEKGEAGEAKK